MPSLCNFTDAVCKRAGYLSRCYVNGRPMDTGPHNAAYTAMYKKAAAEGYHGSGPRMCRACALMGGTLACERLDECPRDYWRPPRPQCPVGGLPRSAPRFVAPRHFPRPGPGPARAARFPAPRRFRRSFRGVGQLEVGPPPRGFYGMGTDPLLPGVVLPDLPGYVTEEKCSAAQLSAEEKAKGSVLPWAIGAGVGALVLGLAIGRMSK